MKKIFKFTCLFLCLLLIGTFTVACGGGGGGGSASSGGFAYIPTGANGNNGNNIINPISPDAEYSFDNTKEASVSFTDGKTEKTTPTISSLESTVSVEMPNYWEITDTKNIEGLTKGNYRFINNWLYTTNDSGSASDKLTFTLPVNSGDRRTEKVNIKSGDKTYNLTIVQAGFKEDPEKRGNISADKTLLEVDSLSSTDTTQQTGAVMPNSTKEKIKITVPNFQGELKVLGGQGLDVAGAVAVDNYRVVDLTIYENLLGNREGKIRIFANTDYIDITVKQQGAFTVGQGTEDDPFIISNLDDLNKLSRAGLFSSWVTIIMADKNFKINADISGINSPIILPGSFSPYNKYCTIDGNGKKLTANINVTDGNASASLFRDYIQNGTITIKNLTVAGKITGSSIACGIMYGYNPTITNCTNEAEVTTTDEYGSHASGITYQGTVTNCTNKGKITASGVSSSYAGGIVAYTYEGNIISNCTNEGDVTASSGDAGGIVGYHYRATIKDCKHKSGVITGSGSGYIAGYASDELGLKISGCKYKTTEGSTATRGVGNYEDSESGCENDETL